MALAIFSEERRKWWTLAAVSFGLFMIMLDNTVVNVALPAIQEDLGADLSQLQWIVAGYALTFAALMLIGGKLADAFGRRLIFVIGIVIFTLASLWCGLSGHRRDADRGACRAGRRRGADEPRDAVDHLRHLPAEAARSRDRHLGGSLGARARHRASRRRPAHRASELALDLLHQRAGRRGRNRGQPHADHGVEGRDAREPRPARPRHIGARALRAHVRPDRGEHVRLDVRADRRLVRRRRRRAGLVRDDRAA